MCLAATLRVSLMARPCLQAWAVWDSFTFVWNGRVFVLIGLQPSFCDRSHLRSQLRQTEPMPQARHIFIVGWTRTRGLVSLPAAIGLPQALSKGANGGGSSIRERHCGGIQFPAVCERSKRWNI